MKKLLTYVPYILIAILVGCTAAYAGSLTPPGPVGNTMYTLEDIYNLANGTPTSEGSGSIPATPGSIAATGKTLTEVYNAVASHAGADLSNMWNGTCHNAEDNNSICPNGDEFVGGSQANGGVDDFNGYNLGGARPEGSFETTWTTCNVGNSYCGTGDAGANAKDTATGLVWSYPCHDTGCSTWDTSDAATLTTDCLPDGSCAYYNTDTYYTWDNSGDNNDSNTAQQLCSTHAGWSLPGQKQLMQAYIDGSYGNLEPQGVYRVYWSATTVSSYATYAWFVYLSNGGTVSGGKGNPNYQVRCVRE